MQRYARIPPFIIRPAAVGALASLLTLSLSPSVRGTPAPEGRQKEPATRQAGTPQSRGTPNEPYSKEALLRALKTLSLPTAEILNRIWEDGVSFQMTPATEEEIREAGSFLPKGMADEVIKAAVSWNLYERFQQYKHDDPKKALEAGQEYLRQFAGKNRKTEDEIREFIAGYKIPPDRQLEDLLERARAASDKHLREEAASAYIQVLRLDRQNFEARDFLFNFYQNRGEAAFAKKAYDQAIVDFSQSLNYTPFSYEVSATREKIGDAYMLSNRPKEALDAYNNALIVSESPDPELHLGICNALRALKQFDSAIKSCQQSIKLSPAYAAAYYSLGLTYEGNGRPKDALLNFQLAADKSSPPNAPYLLKLGQTHLAAGGYFAAAGLCDRARQAAKTPATLAASHVCVGDAYWKVPSRVYRQKAVNSYKEAVNLAPNVAEYNIKLGTMRLSIELLPTCRGPWMTMKSVLDLMTSSAFRSCTRST